MNLNRGAVVAGFKALVDGIRTPVGGAGAVGRCAIGLGLALFWVGVRTAQCQVVPAEQLKIEVKQGEKTIHHPGDKAGTLVVVQVLNELDLPQPEALVTFTADTKGSSVLLNGERTQFTVASDAQGMASVSGVIGNKIKGAVTIQVQAAFEGKTGKNTVHQVNERAPFWNRTRASVIGGALATTGIILYEVLKPGPPTATINTPTATTSK